MKRFLFILTLSLFFSCAGLARDLQVEATNANIYDSPDGKPVARVTRGKVLIATDEDEKGYIKLKTKSGQALWIKAGDVKERKPATDDLEESDSDFNRWTWDLGFSTGSLGGTSYSEADVGINYFFERWLAWRNAPFARFIQPTNVYGLDTSARFFYTVGLSRHTGFTLFGGPGFRFATLGGNVPFVEGGLVSHLGPLTLGIGVKTFFTQVVQPGAAPDTQYFLILAGGGAL